MTDLRYSMIIDMAGNLASRARAFGGALTSFSANGTRDLRGLARVAAMAGQGLDRLGNRYTALATGAAGLGTAKYLTGLDTRFTRLGIQAQVSADRMDDLKRAIFETAQAPDIRIDPAALTAAIEMIVEKTGDLAFAETNMRTLAAAIQAAGAAGEDVGALAAEMKKFGLLNLNEVLTALDTLNAQGKAGAFTFQNFASQGERLAAAYAATGRSGRAAVMEMGALAQVARMATGGAEQAATAVEAFLRTLQDAEKVKKLKAAGISLYDEEALKQGEKRLRAAPEIMKDIIARAGGDTVKISTIFDGEAMRALNAAIVDFKNTGAFGATLDKFMGIAGDGSATLSDSAKAADTAEAALVSLRTAWTKFADANLTQPIRDLADALNSLSTDQVDRIIKTLGYGAVALGGLVIAGKAARGVGGLLSLFNVARGRGAAGAAMAGTVPVLVTNWPMAGLATTNRGAAPRATGRAGSVGGMVGVAAGSLVAMSYGANALEAYQANDRDGLGGGLGGAAGALAGAAAGAALGSFIPVVGTAIGGILGSILGGMGGDKIGRLVTYDPHAARRQDHSTVDVNLKIDSDGKPRVAAIKTSSDYVDVDVDAGIIMGGM